LGLNDLSEEIAAHELLIRTGNDQKRRGIDLENLNRLGNLPAEIGNLAEWLTGGY